MEQTKHNTISVRSNTHHPATGHESYPPRYRYGRVLLSEAVGYLISIHLFKFLDALIEALKERIGSPDCGIRELRMESESQYGDLHED